MSPHWNGRTRRCWLPSSSELTKSVVGDRVTGVERHTTASPPLRPGTPQKTIGRRNWVSSSVTSSGLVLTVAVPISPITRCQAGRGRPWMALETWLATFW